MRAATREHRSRGIATIRKLARLLPVIIFLVPGLAGAVTKEDFVAKTTRNLVNLCTVSADDPLHREAIHFCEGYLVGAYHFHISESAGPGGVRLVCFPKPPPSRDQAVSMFVEWVRAHPQYMNESPVETEFRFLIEKWPCKK
jgi:hypothetical protein